MTLALHNRSPRTAWLLVTAGILVLVASLAVAVFAGSETSVLGQQPPAASLEQCRNGAAGSPNTCEELSGDAGWVSGNAGSSNAHYVEGYSIPYRAVLTSLPTDGTSITLILGYDITHSSRHALDYLTHYDRLEPHAAFGHAAESIDPTDGVTITSATVSTFPIPAPGAVGSPVAGQPTTSFNAIPGGERVFTLFGGTITNVAYVTEGNASLAQAETQIAVTFTVDSADAVLSWGGHIASREDWGFDGSTPRSAGGISGSPYHMRLIDWTLNNLGNQDRSLSADAVLSPEEHSLTVCKIVDDNGDDFTNGGSFTFDVDVDGANADPATVAISADEDDGKVCSTTTYTVEEGSSVTVTETGLPAGWTSTAGYPRVEVNGVQVATSASTWTIADLQGETEVTFRNQSPAENPSISIVKSTNGEDADSAPGPYVPVGSTVNWEYEVTNTGNVELTDIEVTDDQGVTVNCPETTLGPGESMTCTASGTATAGQYTNIGTAEGTPPNGPDVSDTDPSNYFGADPAITIEKSTNTQDADGAPGPIVSVGDPISWTYVVTNTGNVALTDVTVTDDQGVTVTCPQTTLDVGESMTCTANGTAIAGQYTNIGTAEGTDPTDETVDDTDPSNYFGADPAITIEKDTNGADADTAPGPSIPVGNDITWSYVVTNTGNVDLINVTVADDQGLTVTCPQTTLDVDESMTCTAEGTAIAGQYENLGTAQGTDPTGETVDDNDPSHYFGSQPGIDIEKATNSFDADDAPGPSIAEGDPVTWTYVVTNTGNVTLTNVTVTDDQGVTVICPTDTLAPSGQAGDSMTCTASGNAAAGQYENVGTATGTTPTGGDPSDSDPSHYFGVDSSIDIEKATNGEDADLPPGPTIIVGDPVAWTYVVTNTGNVALTDVTVTDDQGVTVECPQTTLAVDESMTCTGAGTAQSGQYTNVGTVTALDTLEATVTDNDPSHYFGLDQYTVTVCKIVEENGDIQENGGDFAFTSGVTALNGTVNVAEGAEDCSLMATVNAGDDVTVTESASRPAGWTEDEDGYPEITVNNDAALPGQSSVTVSDIQDDVTITFRNRAEPLQRLRVCKDVIDSQDNAPATSWTFNSDLFDSSITLTGVDASDGRLDNCSEWVSLPWGTESVTIDETDPGVSWDTGWNADNSANSSGTDNTGDRTATFPVDADDQDITVVFTNTRILLPVQVCKQVIDNGAAPGGEGDTFPVEVTYTRNGVTSTQTFNLTQNENNNATANPCDTVLVDRGSTVTVDETTLPAGWSAAGATQGSTTPPGADNLPFTSSAITGEGTTIYVFNELGVFDVTVCKVIDQNEDVGGTESGSFNFGGTFGAFDLVADGDCEVRSVSSGADVTINETGIPASWENALDYPQVAVNDGLRTVDTNTVTVNDIAADTTITFYNKLAPELGLSKVPAEIAYASGFAHWQIIIDNTGDGAIERDVLVRDIDAVLDGAAPAECTAGTINDAEGGLECTVGAGETLIINVQRAVGQMCVPSTAENDAFISVDEGELVEVSSDTIEIPGDEELCDDPLIEKESLGYNAANGVITWQITVDNDVENATERSVLITDPGVTLVNGLPQGCTGAIATGMTCVLQAGASVTFEVQRSVTEQCQPGQAANQATATVGGSNIQGSPANADPVTIPADEDACIVPPLDKDAVGYSVDEQTASWTITVDNTGGDTIERTVVITDDNVTFVSQNPTNACTSGALATGLTCTIPAGTLLTLTVEREVAQTCQPGVAINTAEATLDGEPLPGSPAVATPIVIPGSEVLCDPPDLDKVATGFVTASSLATWRIIIDNSGTDTVDRTVVITDPDVDLVLTLPAGACDTTNSSLDDGLVCEVAAGETLQLFVTRGPFAQLCSPQTVTNTASATLLDGSPLDGSPTGAATVNIAAIDSVLCGEIEIPSATPTNTPEPEETPTPDETPTGEPTAVLPTVVEPPSETPTEDPTATNTPEPTATDEPTGEPTAVLPTVVVPEPPASGSGMAGPSSQAASGLLALAGLLLLGAGLGLALQASRRTM